ncbi:hypothetical protein GA0115259_108755, partial [Streptomyces sp. MnatMP-M17]
MQLVRQNEEMMTKVAEMAKGDGSGRGGSGGEGDGPGGSDKDGRADGSGSGIAVSAPKNQSSRRGRRGRAVAA